MNTKKDYYGVLGIDRDANPDVIRKAYLGMVRRFHPDLNPGDKAAARFFREAQEAYEVLTDESKRSAYDRSGTSSPRRPRDARSNRRATPDPEYTDSDQGSDTETPPDAGTDDETATAGGCGCIICIVVGVILVVFGC